MKKPAKRTLVRSRVAKGNARLKAARVAAGYSQRDLAALVGVTEQVVGRWETRRAVPSRENRERVATLLDVSTFEIWEE